MHIAGTLWLCWMVVRDILDPQHDPVRADGLEDDPAGGVLDGAPDVFVSRGRARVRLSRTTSGWVVVSRTAQSSSSPIAGGTTSCGRKISDTCMCGGSTNHRWRPAQLNGDRLRPTASMVPSASTLARASGPRTAFGASSATPCAVPPLTTTRWPADGARCWR